MDKLFVVLGLARMADVRALLKAKRQEVRINHPLAAYSQAGQLRCTACGVAIKHASAWEGHVGSKGHRTSVARLKDGERIHAEQLRQKAEEDMKSRVSAVQAQQGEAIGTKRKSVETEPELLSKKARIEEDRPPPERSSTILPSDFFSDPSKAPGIPLSDSEDEVGEQQSSGPPPKDEPSLEDEWEKFQREVVNGPDLQEAYERATVMAEPQVVETSQGLPVTEAKPEEPLQNDSDADKQRRRELEERELIMDRLLEEERAQEEADQKVVVMKSRIDALKKKREAAKSSRTKKSEA